jgi:hypothetical protein
MEKKMVARLTIKRMNSENPTLPIYFRRSLDSLLERADLEVKQEMTVRGQQGGRAPKADPLTVLIRKIVASKPDISLHDLLCQLKRESDQGTIFSIAIYSYVEYYKENGQSLRLPILAVKDRLYRARKKINSR